ncbi:NTP transferase domain-containing protein [Rhizobium sp. AQ_MP]|jgi:glucose-1-phosphate thymidylyltransferase|uniref:sugar nucleotidyltransferase n=1 Tax=Rhizobium sp. AQ_MP TaxID=2761536 RepID=UPI00163B1C04|nr:sugar phosphate nucleotidyltransferase [Rhizobium sp. AQ_MP]MBC2774696.1 NTP transferase domain-containing protein [Rhizobium sp. AQ_MP]
MSDLPLKGVVLSGGKGTRLYPSTLVACKQLLPVFDKPMIHYPLSLLLLQKITEILFITNPEDLGAMQRLLGTGEQFGAKFSYMTQADPRGIAEGLILSEEFLAGSPVCFLLGDNILFGQDVRQAMAEAKRTVIEENAAAIFGYRVSDPQNFGVITFGPQGSVIEVVEKPAAPKSTWASIGVYFFPGDVPSYARQVMPSPRNELEITDVHRQYIEGKRLKAIKLGRGTAWLDTGTPEAIMEAGNFLHAIEKRQGLKVYCPEEVAYRSGLISSEHLLAHLSNISSSSYRGYLRRVLEEEKTDLFGATGI